MHHNHGTLNAHDDSILAHGQTEELLPFTVRIVRTGEALDKAVRIRQEAYSRHVPELARSLGRAESYDGEAGTIILLAESKLDGSAVGTMRIQTNQHKPLSVEHSLMLPEWLQGYSLAEATRLGIIRGRIGHMAKIALFKAYYLYCLQTDVDWMVITARAPLDRQYEALLFQDITPDGSYIPMRHIGNLPHRPMALSVTAAQNNWSMANHPLLGFMVHTHHPDIHTGPSALHDSTPTQRYLRMAGGASTLKV